MKEENEALPKLVRDSPQTVHVDPIAERMVLKAALEVLQNEKAELEQAATKITRGASPANSIGRLH